jgi:hypothetical protein
VSVDQQATTQAAADFAGQASAVAAKLKPGTYEAAQALALISIAHSLTALAQNSQADQQR